MIRPFSQLVVLTSLFHRPTYGCDAATRPSLSGTESTSAGGEASTGKSTKLHPARGRRRRNTNRARQRGRLKLTIRELIGSDRPQIAGSSGGEGSWKQTIARLARG